VYITFMHPILSLKLGVTWRIPAVLAGVDPGTGLGGPLDSVGFF